MCDRDSRAELSPHRHGVLGESTHLCVLAGKGEGEANDKVVQLCLGAHVGASQGPSETKNLPPLRVAK